MNLDDPVVITCSISGAIANREQCPAIPYTPAEYAAEARRIVDEGGVMIHIHARKPDGTPSYEVEDFAAITEAIRSEVGDAVIQSPDDCLVLLDENGQPFTSVELAHWLDKRLAASQRRIILLIGGAFGFAPEIYSRADFQLSLSRLTFSHQMARLFLLEQLYRAMTILRNEPYHNL